MVFYYYENAMRDVDKISIDGIVPKSAHLSHWPGNLTPIPLKADTATAIVFRYLSHPDQKDFFPKIRIITNNHFDTDGLLSVWAMLNSKRAEPMAARMISAAEAGDFSAFSSEEGVQVNLLVNAFCQNQDSPIFNEVSRYDGPREAAFYKYLLPIVPDIFRKKDQYRPFWEPPFEKILHTMSLFEKGVIGVEEYEEERLSVVIDEKKPARQAIDHYCQGDLFLTIEDRERRAGGYAYTLEYRYYSWADTVTRPPIKKIPMKNLAETLNKKEKETEGLWMTENFEGQGLTTVLKYTDKTGKDLYSRIHPETVIQAVRDHLRQHNPEEIRS